MKTTTMIFLLRFNILFILFLFLFLKMELLQELVNHYDENGDCILQHLYETQFSLCSNSIFSSRG